MARYRGAVCRLCRREGVKLFLKGDRCYTEKCAIDRRGFSPGQHGRNQRKGKVSGYGLQLREKQKVKRIYGVLESQFRITFRRAERQKGITGANLLSLLERRLDNVVYRLGFATSRPQARQLVRHGHVSIGSRKMNIPSYTVREGDTISIRPRSTKIPTLIQAVESLQTRGGVPGWLTLDTETLRGTVLSTPKREDVRDLVEEQLIVELYSK
ncbi:MAG: 30S ribosomal protein S4 [Acidobacteria bacterium]|nr:30S ribosomal protein S4 [Acidobacteriota bacterium]MBI3657644.1 30S ribosomal protein S4 [Acidobacteriota bacterium]